MTNKYLKAAILLVAFFGCIHAGFSQIIVKGQVADISGKKLSSIAVSVLNIQELTLAYSITDSLGYYSIKVPDWKKGDSLFVAVNANGYQKMLIYLDSNIRTVDFELLPSAALLKEVVVTSGKGIVRSKGDTIKYNVDSFSHPQDRTILDVLKKMPGLEVSDNGEIKFQGKSINSLYVDGDNLVDGKYNTLTKSLANDMVASIEVLQNHQPIQTLRDIELTETAGLNIVLKSKARMKFLFDASASIGEPGLRDATFNTMSFKKSFKILNALKYSNAGRNIREDIIPHFQSEANARDDRQLLKNEIVQAPLASSRVLLNDDFLEDINLFSKTNQQLEIRFNGSIFKGNIVNEYSNRQLVFLPTDTIRYNESFFTKFSETYIRPSITVSLNKKKIYFNNTSGLETQVSDAASDVTTSTSGHFQEKLRSRKTDIFNSSRFLKVLSPKLILELYSYLFYRTSPQLSQLTPGLYSSLLNNGHPYDALAESARNAGFTSRNYASIKYLTKIRQSYKVGVDWQSQQIVSDLQTELSGVKTSIADTFRNHLNFYKTSVFAEAVFSRNSDLVQYEFALPVEKMFITYRDTGFSEHNSYLFFQPSFKIKSRIGKQGFIQLSSSVRRTIGNQFDIYRGYILNGYRTFNSKVGILPVSKISSVLLSYELNDVPDFLFATVSMGYYRTNNNTIPLYAVSPIATTIVNYRFDNTTDGFNLGLRVSKYVPVIRSNFALSQTMSLNEFLQFQNGFLLKYLNSSWTTNCKFSVKPLSFLFVNYSLNLNMFVNTPVGTSGNQISQRSSNLLNKIDFTIPLNKAVNMMVAAEFYKNSRPGIINNNTASFMDFTCEYKPAKVRYDLQLGVFNILNRTGYQNISTSSNFYSESVYLIRPRNFFIKINYRF
ncbi:hypothetical protein GWC95_13435 [Sediminibacterium roseum]|uniref:Carboxypeptidase regulatory-like domain-containing protein n=1 Tax=Sediminibacterium roseum TaxID=1978412 RepID=A0ABX0A127_9BACT|nr:hypothetical protein [Sediminibacterium roseum]NCI50930.1 hypothetical protein [Sediminibacterium roseum]